MNTLSNDFFSAEEEVEYEDQPAEEEEA